MKQGTLKLVAIFLVGMFAWYGVDTYLVPLFDDGGGLFDPEDPQYSQTIKFITGVTDQFNETSTDNMSGGTLYIYTTDWTLKESISVSARTFTSALYYTSGDTYKYKLTCTGFESIVGEITLPYYQSTEIPAFHVIDNVIVSRSPTAASTYSINGVYNTSAQTTYNVTVSGNTITVSVEYYNTRDETQLMNWADSTYSYVPIVVIENVYNGTGNNDTCSPLDVSISGLELVRAETSTQTGLYIAIIGETELDRDRNQASGVLTTNNRITVSFTLDVSQIASGEYAFLRWSLYDNTDANYFRTYGAVLSVASTLQTYVDSGLGGQLFVVA